MTLTWPLVVLLVSMLVVAAGVAVARLALARRPELATKEELDARLARIEYAYGPKMAEAERLLLAHEERLKLLDARTSDNFRRAMPLGLRPLGGP